MKYSSTYIVTAAVFILTAFTLFACSDNEQATEPDVDETEPITVNNVGISQYNVILRGDYSGDGALEALTAHGIDFDPSLFCELFVMRNFEYETMSEPLAQAIDKYLSRIIDLPEPPTALMCICDVMAFTVRQRALALGINVPERLSLTGFDNLRLSGMLDVPLTTMAQNFAEMGRRAVEIIDSINSGRKYESTCYLEAELIVRKSVVDLKRSAG